METASIPRSANRAGGRVEQSAPGIRLALLLGGHRPNYIGLPLYMEETIFFPSVTPPNLCTYFAPGPSRCTDFARDGGRSRGEAGWSGSGARHRGGDQLRRRPRQPRRTPSGERATRVNRNAPFEQAEQVDGGVPGPVSGAAPTASSSSRRFQHGQPGLEGGQRRRLACASLSSAVSKRHPGQRAAVDPSAGGHDLAPVGGRRRGWPPPDRRPAGKYRSTRSR